jgi:hypothetical protein
MYICRHLLSSEKQYDYVQKINILFQFEAVADILNVRKENVREYRRGNQKWAIKRNWQHGIHKTQHMVCPPYANKHK